MRVVVVDLDDNEILIPSLQDPQKAEISVLPEESFEELNSYLYDYLHPELREIDAIDSPPLSAEESEQLKSKSDHYIRMSFVSFFVSLFWNIQTFINEDLEDTEDVFDVAFYLESQVTKDQVRI